MPLVLLALSDQQVIKVLQVQLVLWDLPVPMEPLVQQDWLDLQVLRAQLVQLVLLVHRVT